MFAILRFWLVALFAALLLCQSSFGQDEPKPNPDIPSAYQKLSDMKLIERVAELQRQIESPDISKRDAAEKELIAHGVRVLDYLEPTNDKTTTDGIQRINRIRATLEKIAVAAVTQCSTVTLKGKMSVATALAKIKKQSGNNVYMPDETPDLFKDKEIEIEFKDAPFWEVLADVMEKGDLIVDTYGGDRGLLVLTPTDEARIAAAAPAGAKPPKVAKTKIPRNVSGIFDLAVTQVSAARNLTNPKLNYCNLHVLIRWEPRVTPISIVLPASTIKAVDEFDSPIEITNKEAVMSGTVQNEIPELEFTIPIGLLDRQIEEIKSFDARIDAVLPGRVETFKFKKLGKLEVGAKQTKAGATVTFGGIEKNEDLFGVNISLGFDEEHNALESHQSWVYNNTVELRNDAGDVIEPLAYEGVRQTNNQITIRYYFDKDPKPLSLHYKTPAAIVKVPVKISLKKIPLP